MAIIDDLLTSVKNDSPVRRVVIGPFITAVMADRCGLASTSLYGDCCHGEMSMPDAGRLTERTALELAGLVRNGSPLESAVGVAALNTLLVPDEAQLTDLNARDLLMEKGRGGKVAIVGHFPFVPALRKCAGHLSVLELNPLEGDLDASEASRVIPDADVVAITGTSLTNHTLDDLLKLCSRDSFVVVLGASTPLSPVLFDYGVDVVAGTVVSDPELAMRYAGEGANFRQIQGIRRVNLFREGRKK
ncbi:MAG: Rossmann-like domain-containing protein [Chloroflexota bacterium]|jgi:uncharacterized protein (DUF4213/DUF364 family)